MKRSYLILAAFLSASACDPGEFGAAPDSPENDFYVPVEHGMIELGEKLDDPYTVENMTKAFLSLYPTKASPITTTDLYVRFLPSGDEQYQTLEDLGIDLIDHPVDYRIVREGDYYHDPSVPEDEITWQYAIVPPDFKFPTGIRYEILDRCYIAEHEVITRASDGVDWDAVERESFRLTGNDWNDPGLTKSSTYPAGRITIVDDRHPDADIGVKGVKVSANVFVKFATAYTDDEGNYKIGTSFSKQPRYRIVFKNRKGFAIGFNLVIVQASMSTLGKASPAGKSVRIDRSSNRLLFCRSVVNNAAYDYYNSCDDEEYPIKTPPSDLRIWLLQLLRDSSAPMLHQGAAVDSGVISEFLGEYSGLIKMFLPDVTIGIKGKDDYASIYGATVHELAHASHYMQVGNSYWTKLINYTLKSFITAGGDPYGSGTASDRGYCGCGEMWAYFVQTRMYRDRYPSEGVSFGSSFWFKPQVFFYMDERGLTKYRIFRALTSDIHDIDDLEEKLLYLYPECKSIIQQAFERYQ